MVALTKHAPIVALRLHDTKELPISLFLIYILLICSMHSVTQGTTLQYINHTVIIINLILLP
jgi:hypothetical protein